MKKVFLYLCTIVCTLSMMISCSMADAHSIAGTYIGGLEVGMLPPVSKEVQVMAIGDNQVEIAFGNIYLGESLGSVSVKVKCAVVVIGDEVELAGSTSLSFGGFSYNAISVTGEVEDGILELTIALPGCEVEYQGLRKEGCSNSRDG